MVRKRSNEEIYEMIVAIQKTLETLNSTVQSSLIHLENHEGRIKTIECEQNNLNDTIRKVGVAVILMMVAGALGFYFKVL